MIGTAKRNIKKEGENMLKFRVSLFVVLVFVLAFSVVQAQDVPDVAVKLAVLGPFTGDAASIGQEQLAWAQLAVADFNEATGWNVEVVEGDTQLNPELAVTVAEQIIADADVYGAVGPAGSQEVSAAGEMFFDARLVHISGSATNPDLTTMGYDTFFRTVPTDAVQGPTVANFVFTDLGATQLFIIDDQSSYSVGLADQAEETFTDLGGTVVGRESVTQQDTDFSSLVTVIGSSGAEAVFFPGQIASQGALIARQIQEQGVEATLVGGDGFLNVNDFITGAGGATEGAFVSNFAPDVRGIESSAEIVARYVEANDDNFTAFGPPSYAAALAVLEAMQRAFEAGDLSREAVRDEVANTEQEMSVLGIPLAFDENGDVLGASFYIYQVEGDTFVVVPITPIAGEPEVAETEEASG
jgi:branched-chain amino acid transport system substrate-binding protein